MGKILECARWVLLPITIALVVVSGICSIVAGMLLPKAIQDGSSFTWKDIRG
jgi:hypothetical protein